MNNFKYFIFLYLLLSISLVSGQDLVLNGGKITGSERWSGTVLIKGDVEVAEGARLTISPGSRIIFEPDTDLSSAGEDKNKCGITVKGTLVAQGRIGRKVYFTSNSASPRMGDWEGLRFIKLKEISILDYCVIEYATNGITMKNSNVQIRNCEVRYNFNAGIRAEVRSKPTIMRSIISENDYAGIVCNLGAQPVLTDNLVTLNRIGLVILSSSQPDLGVRNARNNQNPGRNRILNNEEYDIYNHSAKPVNAQNNIWESNNSRDIEVKIFDASDDGRYGRVTFLPVYVEESDTEITDLILLAQTDQSAAPQTAAQLPPPASQGQVINQDFQRQQSEQPVPTTEQQADTTENLALNTINSAQISRIQPEIQQQPVAFNDTPPAEEIVEEAAPQINYEDIFLEPFLDNKKKEYVTQAKPSITAAVRNAMQAGAVRVRVVVGKDGRVEEATVLKGINNILNETALEAARRFRYKPGTLNGKPVRFSTMEIFIFR